MKKGIYFFFSTIFGLIIGLVFFLIYIHAVSWLAYPIGLLVVLAVVIVGVLWLGHLAVNIKDFIVSIFKDDDTRDEKGFKKHF